MGLFGPRWPILPLLRHTPLYIGKNPIPRSAEFYKVQSAATIMIFVFGSCKILISTP
jgi:hypothetical protein